jgi:hypothetical protein
MSYPDVRPSLIKDGVIKAVHDSDLEQFLTSLEEWDDFKAGSRKCKWCDIIVIRDNLYSIFPVEQKEIAYCCSSPGCIATLSKWCAGKGGN